MSTMWGPLVGVAHPWTATLAWFYKVLASLCDVSPSCIVLTPTMKSTRRALCREPPPWQVKSGKYQINGTKYRLDSQKMVPIYTF